MTLFRLLLHKIFRFHGKVCCYLIQIILSRNAEVPCTSSYPSTCPCLVLQLDFRIVEGRDLVFSSVACNSNSNNCCCLLYAKVFTILPY